MIRLRDRVWQRVCLFLLGGGAIGMVGLCAWPYTVDDAYIVARYAVRIGRAEGYTFNPGPATDGVTGPAWLLPGLAATWLGVDPVAAAKVCGLACAVAAVLWCVRERSRRAGGSLAGWVTALIAACQPSLGGSGSSGLETGAAMLAVSVAMSAALAHPQPRPYTLGVALAGAAWLRPELAPLALALLALVSVRRGVLVALPAWLLALLGAAGVCAFRASIAGTIVPLSFHAKAGTWRDGWFYSMRALLVMTGLFGCGLAASGAWLGQTRDRWRAGLLLVHAVSVALAGGDWMPGFRLFVPMFPQYAQLTATGVVRLVQRGRTWRVVAGMGLCFACGVPLVDLATRLPEWRAAGESRDRVGRELAERLRTESHRVALVDIGYLGYASGCEVVDLAGITDPEVAALRGGHLDKHVTSAWLRSRRPDTIVLHSSAPPTAAEDGRLLALNGYPVERRVARSEWITREFRVLASYRYAPGYYYVVLRHAAAQAVTP
ncbi:MAG: hypothetical protein ABW321_04480 [Polyangiales bacterium]